MPYKDPEKQHEYMCEYAKKQRELFKRLKEEAKKTEKDGEEKP